MTPEQNHRRGDLIEWRIAGTITDDERAELERLQAVADEHVRDELRRDLEWVKKAGDIERLTGSGPGSRGIGRRGLTGVDHN